MSANTNQTINPYSNYTGWGSSISPANYDWTVANFLAASFGVLVVITNIVNVVVFAQKNMRTNSMYAYLLAKSINDLFIGADIMLEPISNCYSCFTLYLYWYQVFIWIYRHYLGNIAKLMSVVLEAAATFDRYMFISGNFKFIRKIDHRLIIVISHLICALFYSYKFFINEIYTYIDDRGLTGMRVGSNAWGSKYGNDIFNTIHSILRDGIFVVIIVIVNVFILFHMKKAMAKKKAISGSHSVNATSTTAKTKSKADRAEDKITIMVILTGIAAVVSHGLRIISYLPVPIIRQAISSIYYYDFSESLYHSSFVVGLFFYYFFNNIFRETLWGLFAPFRKSSPPRSRKSSTKEKTGITVLSK